MRELYNEICHVASKIEKSWKKYDYSSDDFYKVAWEQTENLDLSPLGTIENQLELLKDHRVRSHQYSTTFSDMHLQVFENGRFFIEVLNWWGSHVNVHDHDFSGVQFQLKGQSLNVQYDFTEESRFGAMRLGSLKARKAEIWNEGERSIVRHGAIDPHCVFHLSLPTTSLLIRTVATSRYGAQSNYFPSIAAHYDVSTIVQRKKLTALSLLSEQCGTSFRRELESCINTQSKCENFFMLLKLAPILFRDENKVFLHQFADRGPVESKIIRNVIYNNSIDRLKKWAFQKKGLTQEQKISLCAVAASCNVDNYNKIKIQLESLGHKVWLPQDLLELSDVFTKNEQISFKQILDSFQLATKYE